MNETLIAPLLKKTIILSDLHRLIVYARLFIEYVKSKPGLKFEIDSLILFIKENKVPYETAQIMESLEHEWYEEIAKNANNNNTSALTDIKNTIDNLPVLGISIPVEFPSYMVTALGDKAKTLIDKTFVVELHVDKRAVGGAIIRWNGIERDLSLRYLFTKYKKEIMDLSATNYVT